MARATALVTGGSSGIGLALVQHLTSLQWNVMIVDLNPPIEMPPGARYVRTDIESWDEQARAFAEAYSWTNRLDFCALNAGVDDRDDIFTVLSGNAHQPPKKPNIKTFAVNLIGTYYGIKLAAFYMTIPSEHAGKVEIGGKIILTSSGAGLYPVSPLPQYTATKHGLLGLGAALGRSEPAHNVNVRINVICPAIVATSLLPPELLEKLPGDQITPIETIIKCFETLANFEGVEKREWVREGESGAVIEGNMSQIIWHSKTPKVEEGTLDRAKGREHVAAAYYKKVQALARSAGSQ